MGKKRVWEVPAEDDLPAGWMPDSGQPVAEVDISQFPSEAEAEEQLFQELANAAWVLKRFGGVITAAADREELAPDIWRTTRYLLIWESYAPGRRRQPEPAPEPEAEAIRTNGPPPPPIPEPEPSLAQ